MAIDDSILVLARRVGAAARLAYGRTGDEDITAEGTWPFLLRVLSPPRVRIDGVTIAILEKNEGCIGKCHAISFDVDILRDYAANRKYDGGCRVDWRRIWRKLNMGLDKIASLCLFRWCWRR